MGERHPLVSADRRPSGKLTLWLGTSTAQTATIPLEIRERSRMFVRVRQQTRDLGRGIRPSVLEEPMAAVCQVTGAVPGFGHNISHSHRRTKRRFDPNVQKKTYFVPSLRRNITINVSAKGIKVIDARGIEAVVKDMQARGVKL
jgi:large subunit ribosomal protein L28